MLRKVLLYNNSDDSLEESELENAVDIFLLFLRTYNTTLKFLIKKRV